MRNFVITCTRAQRLQVRVSAADAVRRSGGQAPSGVDGEFVIGDVGDGCDMTASRGSR
jgi:hypothetical protein